MGLLRRARNPGNQRVDSTNAKYEASVTHSSTTIGFREVTYVFFCHRVEVVERIKTFNAKAIASSQVVKANLLQSNVHRVCRNNLNGRGDNWFSSFSNGNIHLGTTESLLIIKNVSEYA